MQYKPILIVSGEPNSIFFEIFFKTLKKKIFKSPLILIGSIKLLKLQMKELKYNIKINQISTNSLTNLKFDNKLINVIDVEYNCSKPFDKISNKSKDYIENCFKIAFKIINQGTTDKLISGPISKKSFLNKKYLGLTEYIAEKFNTQKKAMLIYNKKLSVCPLTTHLPLKKVVKEITKINIYEKTSLINNFYKKYVGYKPRIAILGLNPHCESVDKFNEDEKIIKPAVKYLKKLKYNILGPFSADTIFLKENRKKFDVIIGMYHDQVLTPIKTLFEYDAINITLGLPFLRVSPDHGPNEKMLGKNISNPISLIKAITFLDKKID